jgi:cell division protein ZipA
MEVGVREILIVIVILVIVGILVDGFRRARQARKNTLRVAIKKPGDETIEDDFFRDYNPELPSASVRVIKPAEKSRIKVDESDRMGSRFDEQTSKASSRPVHSSRDASFVEETFDIDENKQDRWIRAEDEEEVDEIEPALSAQEEASIIQNSSSKKNKTQPVEHVVAINLASRSGMIEGESLLRVITNNGLRFGEMGLFHRMDSLSDVEGAKLFSMANMVKPGNFDLTGMANFKTPGVCLFLTLPGPRAPRGAFETMLETAQRMASILECDLRDETQSALTQQTIAHYRQRVDEFCRKQISASKFADQ